VLFFHFLLSIPAPSLLCEPGGDTFANLLSYLGLSSQCSDLLAGPEVVDLVRLWASRPTTHKMLASHSPLVSEVVVEKFSSMVLDSATFSKLKRLT